MWSLTYSKTPVHPQMNRNKHDIHSKYVHLRLNISINNLKNKKCVTSLLAQGATVYSSEVKKVMPLRQTLLAGDHKSATVYRP